ncbi:MAG: disulfide bond formation protein B [Aestuariivita sp.]|nr:disulfide bond formation protein B [Aestuariivita sp.]MCY4347034.1 disulfide bond formation protein B [Aestuariivita sp.]
MKARPTVLLATIGSATLLAGAFAFQYIGELAPCQICLWQRWPHLAAVVIGLISLRFGVTLVFCLLGGLSTLSTAAIGFFHMGVEKAWWDGFEGCSAPDISSVSPEELLESLLSDPIVQCSQIPWEFMTLSMAGWNAVISLATTMIWIAAAWQSRKNLSG